RLGQGSADRLRRDRKRASLYRTEAPEAARSLVARRARRRHARPARHPYQRRLGRLLEQARPKQLARKSKPPLPITKICSMIASLWIAPPRNFIGTPAPALPRAASAEISLAESSAIR